MRTKQTSTRAVLSVTSPQSLCNAMRSGHMPTDGIEHFDYQPDAGRMIVRGTLDGVAAATLFLYRSGAVA